MANFQYRNNNDGYNGAGRKWIPQHYCVVRIKSSLITDLYFLFVSIYDDMEWLKLIILDQLRALTFFLSMKTNLYAGEFIIYKYLKIL